MLCDTVSPWWGDAGEPGDPIVDLFAGLGTLASGSQRLCKLLLDCGMLLYCVFAIVGTGAVRARSPALGLRGCLDN